MIEPSHHFRKDEEARKQAAEIAEMAINIPDQAALDKILDDCGSPALRDGVFRLLLPHLTFAPDCPDCGFRRGTARPHPCSPEAAKIYETMNFE